MEFSRKDRLILINQYKILAKLYPDDSEHYDELREILESGYEVFYSQIDEWISHDMPESEGVFVLDVLDLYRAIEDYKRISKDEEIINLYGSYFMGFDGNNESQYMAFARFLVNKQGKFSEQQDYLRKNDNMNSHSLMVPRYKAMLNKWGKFDKSWELTSEQIKEIIKP